MGNTTVAGRDEPCTCGCHTGEHAGVSGTCEQCCNGSNDDAILAGILRRLVLHQEDRDSAVFMFIGNEDAGGSIGLDGGRDLTGAEVAALRRCGVKFDYED